ncbi:tetratricopeptide repeat protein [Carboxylicivirga sp. RSCT41]|uniref:tetratricopeptide repeat protein n=1 Tax=Carboxylicivirga agarovorans TaxID=3417570 RepID=UPI003D334313
MKRHALMILLLVGIIAGSSYTNAQEQQMDSVECLKNYSLYKEALKKKMYDYSIEAWRVMFDQCPDVTIRLYADGVEIYKHYIKKEKDAFRKQGLVDTLLLIYDQRIKYFGDHPKYPEAWVLGRKGLDIVTYRRSDAEALKEAITCFEISHNGLGTKMEPMVAVNWLQATNALMKQGEKIPQDVLNVYMSVDEVLAAHISKQKNPKRVAMLNKASASCVEIVTQSGFDDCVALESALADKFLSVQDDPEALSRFLKLMVAFECTDSELYAKAAEQNYKLNPNAEASYLLAKFFIKQNQFDKAKEYYLKTISQADDQDLQAKCFYELAVVTFSHYKNSPEARKYAKNALQKKEGWGKPHILIGNIYAQESAKYGDSDFEHQAVYWVAIDQFKKAKAVDPECQQEADKQINLYSQYLPDKETGFFHGIQEGDMYLVGSWINEKTTVRYR